MIKVCVFTGTRAEYGLLRPLMVGLNSDPEIHFQLVVSGMHLSPEFGNTVDVIEADGIPIDEKIEILLQSDSSIGICKSVGLGIISFSEALARLNPEILIVLGDRFETFAMASAAMFMQIPIAHIHGGESTQGVVDEAIRHSVTKMSHLHFTSTEAYRQRVIQLGEQPENTHNVGSLCFENLKQLNLLTKDELEKKINFQLGKKSLLVTYHPVILESKSIVDQCKCLFSALDEFKQFNIIFTKANADEGGTIINRLIDTYVENNSRAVAFTSMGQLLYLSTMKNVDVVVGNSSSGIIETPFFKKPTINIGNRQRGRILTKNIINCRCLKEEIQQSIKNAVSDSFIMSLKNLVNPYEKPDTAKKIIRILKSADTNNILMKKFNDVMLNP